MAQGRKRATVPQQKVYNAGDFGARNTTSRRGTNVVLKPTRSRPPASYRPSNTPSARQAAPVRKMMSAASFGQRAAIAQAPRPLTDNRTFKTKARQAVLSVKGAAKAKLRRATSTPGMKRALQSIGDTYNNARKGVNSAALWGLRTFKPNTNAMRVKRFAQSRYRKTAAQIRAAKRNLTKAWVAAKNRRRLRRAPTSSVGTGPR